jgi:uncharacterized protein with LGFP repeats
MIRLFYFLVFLVIANFTLAQSSYIQYCNARFGFCVSYPSTFKAQGESDNGDGQEFISSDGKSSLLVYRDGREAIYESEAECRSQSYLSDITSDETKQVTYKKKGENFYVVSGFQGLMIFYQKTIFTEQGMMTAVFTYPTAQKAKYDAYCSKLLETFN